MSSTLTFLAGNQKHYSFFLIFSTEIDIGKQNKTTNSPTDILNNNFISSNFFGYKLNRSTVFNFFKKN